ncbi:MAG TPA: radical SAM protein [Elusimicrobiales bacterium]|nr:radical SAM protein [Elusimicrobiales bacterium]
MILAFKSFSGTPYLYDSKDNEIYKVDAPVYSAVAEAGGQISRIKDAEIRKKCETAGIVDTALPMQTPEAFEKENAASGIGFTKLTLGISHGCNLRCKYCIYSGVFPSERTHENKLMTKETADKIVDEFFLTRNQDRPKAVIFYGGEPLTNFPIVQHVVERIKKMGVSVVFSMTTNGILLAQDQVLDFLAGNNFLINISFDGPVQDVVRVDTEGKGTFQRLMDVIEKISRKYPAFYKSNVSFNVTVTAATNLPETVKFFHASPLFRGKTLNIIRNYDEDNLYCRKYDFVENEKLLTKEFEALRLEYPKIYKDNPPFHNGCFIQAMASINKRAMGNKGYLPLNSCCYPGMNSAYVDIDGTVCACERTEHVSIGHMSKAAIDAKLVEDVVRRYYEIARKHCPKCWAARLCPKCFSHVKRGAINEENFLEYCDKFRASTLRMLELFVTIKEQDPAAFNDIKLVALDGEPGKNI